MDERQARFEQVYHETYGHLSAYAARRCANPHDAADVVAETYEIAWRKIARLPFGHEALLWLYGIARRVVAGHRRGEARRRSRLAELDADLAALYADPVELTALHEIFATLRADDRELLGLVAWEGLSHEEIAAVLGISRNAVRIRLHRARRRFSDLLDKAALQAERSP
ncbi:RNA polymerase sigma factor [Herbidospora cretacea]|uniref:RNA polymerase sigma factor n=1 Tax=Herbidospora cretacea TaxID=28444 RepID=UPI0007746D3B|nr:RNA polymerase sigma factor [Herbidospora cretacea]